MSPLFMGIALALPAMGSTVPSQDCELHVWPAQATGAVTAGVLSNFGMIGAYADMQANRDLTMRNQAALIESLGMTEQAQAVIAVDLPHLLGMTNTKVVFQTKPIDRKAAPKQLHRMSASTASCYAELVVSLNEYRRSAVRGSSLKTTVTFKDYRRGKLENVTLSEASPLPNFPASTVDEEPSARQAAATAFAANMQSLARRLKKRR